MIPARLALFLSRFGSLGAWDEAGILDRELALYRHHIGNGLRIGIVSYGNREEIRYFGALGGIELLYNRWNLPARVYEKLVPFLFFPKWSAFDLIKTNQSNGSVIPWRVSRMARKPLLARMGYIWSEFEERKHGADSRQAEFSRNVEGRVWRDAARLIVTTRAMSDGISRRYPALASRIRVIPNYVDIERFAPNANSGNPDRIVFVGRVTAQKNLPILLRAMRRNRMILEIVGCGEEEASLRSAFSDLGQRVVWRGRVPHEELPDILNKAGILVSPSLYEGHPKAIIEAMACGLVVIGVETPGIRELLRHRETGWLCPPTVGALAAAIDEVRSAEGHLQRIGENARRFAVENFSLPAIARIERQLIDDVCAAKD